MSFNKLLHYNGEFLPKFRACSLIDYRTTLQNCIVSLIDWDGALKQTASCAQGHSLHLFTLCLILWKVDNYSALILFH